MRTAVIGFRPHTYWTAAVAVAGSAQAPLVVGRRRIVFAEGDLRFVYHQAAEAPDRAAALLDRVRRGATANAAAAIADFVNALRAQGYEAARAATAAASAKLPASLAEITGSHTRIHTAEGNFYRDVVAGGCVAAGLEVVRVEERELPALVGDRVGCDRSALTARLKAMGAELGPPWSEDQRLAMQAAWLLL